MDRTREGLLFIIVVFGPFENAFLTACWDLFQNRRVQFASRCRAKSDSSAALHGHPTRFFVENSNEPVVIAENLTYAAAEGPQWKLSAIGNLVPH